MAQPHRSTPPARPWELSSTLLLPLFPAELLHCAVQVSLLKWNGRVISVDVPNTVELEVVQTDPGVKGNTASGPRLCPRTLLWGLPLPSPCLCSTQASEAASHRL